MAYIGLALCLIFAIVGFVLEKRIIINPITVFCSLWAVIIFFSCLQYYTMYMASDETYGLIVLGIVAYVIGYYLNKFIQSKLQFTSVVRDKKEYVSVPRYGLLYALIILGMVFVCYSLLNVFSQLDGFSLRNVQALLQSGEYEKNMPSWANALSLLIVEPFSFAIPAIAAVDFWYGKRDKKLLILTMALLLLRMLSNANRTNLILIFVYLVIAAFLYMFHNKKETVAEKTPKQKLLYKIRKHIILIVVVAGFAFVLMTMSRGSALFRNVYLNFSMPPKMLEIWATDIEENQVYGYGVASLLGYIYPFFYVVKNALGLEGVPALVQSMYDWTMLTDTKWVFPGKNIRANAYVSIFWFLFTDGRYLGVFLGMLIFGMIVSKAYNNVVQYKHSARQVAIYCLLFYAILFSFVRLQFNVTKYALALFFVIYFAYKYIPVENGEK